MKSKDDSFDSQLEVFKFGSQNETGTKDQEPIVINIASLMIEPGGYLESNSWESIAEF